MSYFNGFAHNSATAVRVIVSAPEHPELDRTIEAPSDAPDAWIANAFLLSVGEDPLPGVPHELQPEQVHTHQRGQRREQLRQSRDPG